MINRLLCWRFFGAYLSATRALCRTSEVFMGTLVLTRPPFFSFEIYADQGDQKENGIQGEMRSPPKFTQDAAAGTGHMLPEVQHHQGDIAGEGGQQRQSEPEPPAVSTRHDEQCSGQRLGGRQQMVDRQIYCMWQRLAEHLAPKLIIRDELTCGSIGKKQNKQCIEACPAEPEPPGAGQRIKVFLHELFRPKVRPRSSVKTVGISCQKGVSAYSEQSLTKGYNLFSSIVIFYP